jgi:tellurite resistance protein TerC
MSKTTRPANSTIPMSFQRALVWSCFWIGLSLGVAVIIWEFIGSHQALAFLAGYTIEKALSVDNLFVFLMLFTHFKIETKQQRRVLNWGVIGVIILRGIMIFAGIGLVNQFEWLMYIFGAIVIYTGVVMSFGKEEEFDPSKNKIIRIARKIFTVTHDYSDDRFFVRQAGKLAVTPLFIVLLVIEFTDVLFAVDSIPAIFAITRDPLIVFCSNILAVLGLRSLYFLLERMHEAFHFVKKGVGVILWFVGFKMLAPLFWHGFDPSIAVSLIVIVGILLGSILLSLLLPHKKESL